MQKLFRAIRSSAIAAAAVWALHTPVALAQAADSPTVQADLDRARLMAGNNPNLQQTLTLCMAPTAYRQWLTTMPEGKKVAQFKALDQLYYLGMKDVGSWALVTSDGIIQFDALDNAEEAERIIVGGYRKLGLDPKQMKYLVITHYHADHAGGAKYLQDTFHPHVILSAADWDEIEKQPATKPDGTPALPMPKRDMAITDGQKLTLGKTTVTLYVTPGHTPGPISPIFPVTDYGQPHTAAFLGGTAFPQNMPAILQSRHSLERFTQLGDDAHADVVLSNHSWFDNTYEDNATDKMSQLARRKPGDPNPFVVGQNEFVRYMTVSMACEQAQEDRLKEKATGQ